MQILDVSRSEVEEVRVDYATDYDRGILTVTRWPSCDGFTIYTLPGSSGSRVFHLNCVETRALLRAFRELGVTEDA